MNALRARSLRSVSGTLALIDLVLVVLLFRRSPLTRPFLGPHDEDLSAWSHGVIATYTLAQAAIALRPSPAAARTLATLRLVLVGGDVMLATRGRSVDRRTGVLTAAGNTLFAAAALRSGGGTRSKTPAGHLPTMAPMV